MTTLTLEVTEEQVQQLSEMARLMDMTLEEVAIQKLTAPSEVDVEFLLLAEEIMEEDRELLERLA